MKKINTQQYSDLFKTFGNKKDSKDTGSPESQIALFTHRIKLLTGHLSANKKDNSSKLSMTKMVGKRKRLLSYLRNKNLERYRSILAQLKLRK